MEGPRATKAEELKDVISLINRVFRESSNLAPTMAEQYPLLLCEDNLDNMRIIVDNGKPVSDINYYKTNILVEGAVIKAASIGAVCTEPSYRGRNLASTILDDVEAKLYREGVDVMLVSGTRSLYRRRGLSIVGGFYKAIVKPVESMDESIEVVDFNKGYLEDMIRIYNMEPVRYYRSLYEFEKFFEGSITPWSKFTYKVFLVKKHESIIGYIVLRIVNDNPVWAQVVEYAGDRNGVFRAMKNIALKEKLKEIHMVASYNDFILQYVKDDNCKIEPENQQGTVKIINFEKLMDSLKPYFAQYLANNIMEALKFKCEDDKYIFAIGNEELCITGQNTLTQLIFGHRADIEQSISLEKELQDKPSIKGFFDKVFPIPFPWTANMNYI